MSHPTEKRLITSDMNEWSADLDTVLPINGEDISGFSAWVNGNGFNLKRDTHEDHDGFDFGAYLRNDGVVVLGLPKETPIRAVANSRVLQILQDLGPYACEVSIEHGAADSGMFSKYVHIDPTIKVGTEVQKGDILGSLHKDAGEVRGHLVHLHLALVDGWGTHGTSICGGGLNLRLQDARLIDPSIYNLTPEKQNWEPFDPIKSLGAVALEIAHFQELTVGPYVWRR